MKYKSFAELSKAVGWERNNVPVPTEEELKKAIEEKNEDMLLIWHRFCPSARTKEERVIQTKIFEHFSALVKSYSGTENQNPWNKPVIKENNGNKNA